MGGGGPRAFALNTPMPSSYTPDVEHYPVVALDEDGSGRPEGRQPPREQGALQGLK